MKRHIIAIVLFLLCPLSSILLAQSNSNKTHAHNDYTSDRPLFSAMESQAMSIEVDVYLLDDELWVTHDPPTSTDTKTLKTLEEQYLKPLDSLLQIKESIYDNTPLFLMIDIKSEAESTYHALIQKIQPFLSFLSSYDSKKQKASSQQVTIYLSGNRPIDQILNEEVTHLLLDGRPDDLARDIPHEVMPIISNNFNKHLSWNGQEKMPRSQWKILKRLHKRCVDQQRYLRLWASPDTPIAWKTFSRLKYFIINTDHPLEVDQFLQKEHQ